MFSMLIYRIAAPTRELAARCEVRNTSRILPRYNRDIILSSLSDYATLIAEGVPPATSVSSAAESVPPDELSAAVPPTPSRSSNTLSGIGSSRRPLQSPLWPGFRTVLQSSTSSSKKKEYSVLHSKSTVARMKRMDPGKPNFETVDQIYISL